MSTTEKSEHWRCLLSDNGLGVDQTIFFDGSNIGVGSQSLEFGLRESTSKAVDNVPLVGNRRRIVERLREDINTGFAVSTILESDDVPSSNWLFDLLHLEEGRRSRESWENAESEDDEVLGEHVDHAGQYDEKLGDHRARELHWYFNPYLWDSWYACEW
jgi:hypothetical protein